MMSKFSEFYDTVDDIVQHIRADLIGPSEEAEVMEIEDPLSQYTVGVLQPQKKKRTHEQEADSAEVDSAPIEVNNSIEELFEEDTAEVLQNSSIFKSSSMGISCAVSSGDILQVAFSYAVYHHETQQQESQDKTFEKQRYVREARTVSASVPVPDRIGSLSILQESPDVSVTLHTRKSNPDGSKLVTISVVNRHTSDSNRIQSNINAVFQCQLSLENEKGFQPLYQSNRHGSEEEEIGRMLYDGVENYAYGHGCSVDFIQQNGVPKKIVSAFIPAYRMPQMMPRLLQSAGYLQMAYWKSAKPADACQELYGFIAQYAQWLDTLKQNSVQIAKYPNATARSFRAIEICIQRLQNGVEVLERNAIAWKAFQYMQEAMLLQRVKAKHCAPETVYWYPFQMAYILQIIPDIVDSNSPFHKDVDLLWFPTGGGKTEAYLGVSAFAIFYRRLCGGKNCNGVTVLMRYTLRLLTLQQFERATALVCACEYLRKQYEIPGDEISIGLWIGSGMTPNHRETARETLQKLREDSTAPIYEANPMQITKCPWCGAEIGIDGYTIDNDGMQIFCHRNSECAFHKHLPIYVVDEDIYQKAPTFILSTVDKFARITWEERAGNLLGANGCKPPELIIQDELHLISGPLGSITGIYETAIEEICKHYGSAPKIIASTATAKQADRQIKILYNRNMRQFPPNGLSRKDSFFAVEADLSSRPARTYVGICAAGAGTSEMLIKIFALLTFLKHLYRKQGKFPEIVDQFYTIVGYFNTLKELGSNSNIISDRIDAELRYLATHRFRKEAETCQLRVGEDVPHYLKRDELTSRNSAKDIQRILERLEHRYTDEDCFDAILASNMLSVGIDIDRLGVMCMYGQPKSNAEYIQATSRVGRSNPGIVVSLYNGMRSRDRSYYEQFEYYHRTFYQYVEATSVTSYSPRAIEKALHCAMMAIIRHTIPKYNSNQSACAFTGTDSEIEAIRQRVLDRVGEIEPRMRSFAADWLDYYLEQWKALAEEQPNTLVFSDYKNEDGALFRSADNHTNSDIPTILNSVRNVEKTANIYFTKR